MVEIVYHVAASIDGYIATPDGGVDWLPVPDLEGEDYGYADFYAGVDGLLMGRGTYEKALEFEWMYAGKPCWVFSRRAIAITQPDVTLTDRSPADIMPELEARQLKRVWLIGGGQLATSFRTQDLISEYLIAVIPVIVGRGIPLLTPSDHLEKLKLVECQTFPDGVVLLRYRRKPNA